MNAALTLRSDHQVLGPASPSRDPVGDQGVYAEVKRLVARFADCDERLVTMSRRLPDLGVDRLALTDVVLGLEARFDIDLTDTEALAWRTVGEIVASVARRIREEHGKRSRVDGVRGNSRPIDARGTG
jgi:acyl carrier protein